MKDAVAILLAAAIGSGAWAKGVASGPAVIVCMETEDSTMDRAQLEASEIFSEIAVNIAWRSGRACSHADAIHIHLSHQTPASLKPGALAYALPYRGTYIEVFYDRVLSTVGPVTLPHLLAHVLVHEITHILQGVARHSDTGIMKAHWNSDDYWLMCGRHLPFTQEDVALIHVAMKTRTERLQAALATPGFRNTR